MRGESFSGSESLCCSRYGSLAGVQEPRALQVFVYARFEREIFMKMGGGRGLFDVLRAKCWLYAGFVKKRL